MCRLCGGACDDADFAALLTPELGWLWSAVADAADRRGDPLLIEGPALTLTLPADPAERAAVSGLVATPLRAGKRVRVPLEALTRMVKARGAALTPGAVAAHATSRPLAVKAFERNAREARTESVRSAFVAACNAEPRLTGDADDLFEHLRRTGWAARLAAKTDPERLARRAVEVVGRVLGIPVGERFDRRLLVPGDPHALDEGRTLAGVVLALLERCSVITNDAQTTSRSAWGQAGVDCDNLTGGLTSLGIFPVNWIIPVGATCTLPPHELTNVRWPPAPAPGRWVFVTENPSVLAACFDLVARDPAAAGLARLLCTMGTPSALEVAAIARLVTVGWNVAVRADFDAAGIRHVTTLLKGIPGAVPWRMMTEDFVESKPSAPATGPWPSTSWDPHLALAMAAAEAVAFEEALIHRLLADLRAGRPGQNWLFVPAVGQP